MQTSKKKARNAEAIGLKIATDLVASCIVGTVIGVSLDNFFNTKPILLIFCLIFALMAALNMIYKYK